MKRITLLRHAKSSWANPDSADIDRTLNARGRRDAPMMGARLQKLGCFPDYILSSTAIRTQETARLLLPALGTDAGKIPFKLDKRVYEASVSMLLDAISDIPESSKHAWLIGHNPGLELLCEQLLPGVVSSMATSAVCTFDVDCPDWTDLLDKPTTLVFHDYPKNT